MLSSVPCHMLKFKIIDLIGLRVNLSLFVNIPGHLSNTCRRAKNRNSGGEDLLFASLARISSVSRGYYLVLN